MHAVHYISECLLDAGMCTDIPCEDLDTMLVALVFMERLDLYPWPIGNLSAVGLFWLLGCATTSGHVLELLGLACLGQSYLFRRWRVRNSRRHPIMQGLKKG